MFLWKFDTKKCFYRTCLINVQTNCEFDQMETTSVKLNCYIKVNQVVHSPTLTQQKKLMNKNKCINVSSWFPDHSVPWKCDEDNGRFLYLWSFPCSRSDLRAGTKRDRRPAEWTCSGTNVELQSCRCASSPSVPAPLFLSFLILSDSGSVSGLENKEACSRCRSAVSHGSDEELEALRWRRFEGLAEILIGYFFVPLNVCVKVKQKVNTMTSLLCFINQHNEY